MFLKKNKVVIFLLLSGFSLVILIFYLQDLKKNELEIELKKVLIKDVRIGVGKSKGKFGTAIFGEISNNGNQIIKIATLKVFFLPQITQSNLLDTPSSTFNSCSLDRILLMVIY